MVVDEKSRTIAIKNEIDRVEYFIELGNHGKMTERPIETEVVGPTYKLQDYEISSNITWLRITRDGKDIIFEHNRNLIYNGISFIVRNDYNYIAFFVNIEGVPGAADTTGKIYSASEAMAYLQGYDAEQYRKSEERAAELGLLEKFRAGKVLIWGKTYYAPPRILNSFWNRSIFRATDRQIFYDSQGNAYQSVLRTKGEVGSEIWIVDPNANYLAQIDVTNYSKILSTYEPGHIFTHSTYVGFGGNIYYYVAGDDFTEVFRIRRTWGEPDLYAMAVNGYTKDSYGEYVDTVLANMSKEELRLLRNHVFALYGYVFKDAALKSYFEKQVWYLAKPEVNLTTLILPAERRALVERIQEEEKKR